MDERCAVLENGDGEEGKVMDAGSEGGGKEDKEMLTVMVVTTCLVGMLKKEVDRRRAVQIAVLYGAGT